MNFLKNLAMLSKFGIVKLQQATRNNTSQDTRSYNAIFFLNFIYLVEK